MTKREANMYKKVVIPLDGSNLAEQALLYLDEIAKDNPRVMLVSITEKVTGNITEKEAFEPFVSEHEVIMPTPRYAVFQPSIVSTRVDVDTSYDPGLHKIPMTVGKMRETAKKYLSRIAKKLDEKGFDVTTSVLIGNPAKEIINFAEEQKADLIVMASTGKSSLNRWNMGNIADKIIKNTRISVMLVKPPPDFVETKPKRKGVSS
jgi:nucleotide-binding universal stress UspA family protein